MSIFALVVIDGNKNVSAGNVFTCGKISGACVSDPTLKLKNI